MTTPSNVLPLGPIVVTGGCGFIGSNLVEALLKLDPRGQIHVVDINVDRNRFPGVTYHACDIASADAVNAVILDARPRTIFHTACPDSMVVLPAVFRRVNVDGAHNLLDSARKAGTVQAFVFTCTSSVIHDNVSNLNDADESLPVLQYPAQKRAYTLTKAEAETDILAANRRDGDLSVLTVSIRPASTFGERDTVTMGKIVASCRAGRGKFQIGPGKNVYDFIHISNLVDAHILAAQALISAYGKPAPPLDLRVDGQCFHVTNHEPMLFWDFQRAVSASIGLPIKPEDIKVVPIWVAKLAATISEWMTWIRTWGKEQPPITREAVHLTTLTRTLNGDKARRILHYEPRVSMHDGIARAGKWFVEEARKEEAAKGSERSKKAI